MKAQPGASGHVEKIVKAAGDANVGKLIIKTSGGDIFWQLSGGDSSQFGTGPCDKTGAAGFTGNASSGSFRGGTYELYVQETSCTLQLYADGSLQFTFKGNGIADGSLETQKDKPWKGTWS